MVARYGTYNTYLLSYGTLSSCLGPAALIRHIGIGRCVTDPPAEQRSDRRRRPHHTRAPLKRKRCVRKHCNRLNLTVSLIILAVRWCFCFSQREQFLGGVLFIRGRPTLRSRKDTHQTDDTRHSHCKRRKMPNQSSRCLFNTTDAWTKSLHRPALMSAAIIYIPMSQKSADWSW